MSVLINPGTGGGGISTITEGVTPTSGFTDGYAITSIGGKVGEAPIRTIRTGNLSLYVTTTGSDITGNGSIGNPWATLQHAFSYLEQTYIFSAANVSLNAAAGSFAGFGIRAIEGSGIVQVIGAGSTQTTITAGPNDGTFNVGECWSGYTFSGVLVGVDGVTFDVSAVPSGSSGINYGIPGLVFFLGNRLAGTCDVAFAGSIADNVYIACTAAVEFGALPIGAGTGITFPGGETCSSAITTAAGTQFIDSATWNVSAGTLTCSNSFVQFDTGSAYSANGSSYSGTVSGPRFGVANNSSVSNNLGPPGSLGINFFPGNQPGTCDASSSYDGFPFAQPISGTPTTADLDAGAYAVFKDTNQAAGLGVVLAYNDAGTIVLVSLAQNSGIVFGPQALPSTGTGNSGYSNRQFVTALVNSLGMVTVTFQTANSSGNLIANHCSIAVKGSATAPNTQATPTELLFSGVSGFTLANNGSTITSDPVALSFSAGDEICVVLDEGTTGDQGSQAYQTGVSGVNNWSKAATASYNQSSVSGFTNVAGLVAVVTEIATS